VCTKKTHLLCIYARLTYIFITFARKAYHSFSENSLIYGNVRRRCLVSLGGRRGLQIVLQPPYLCSLHPCSPKAQPPEGIIQESLILQLSCPNYSQRTKTCFGCAMILTTEVRTPPTCYIGYVHRYHYRWENFIFKAIPPDQDQNSFPKNLI